MRNFKPDKPPTTKGPTIRERSGKVDSKSKLVAFIYLIMRDHVPPGEIEELMREHVHLIKADENVEFSNGWMAEHAKDVARRLGWEGDPPPKPSTEAPGSIRG